MKKSTAILPWLFLMLLLTACSRDKVNLNAESSSQMVPSSSLTEAESSRTESNQSDHIVDDEFIQNVIINFGAEKGTDENGKPIIKPQVISSYFSDQMTEESLTPRDLFSWYYGFIFREGLSFEELNEKYKNPLGEDMGWFFPAKYYEPVCLTYFNVTKEFLRSDPAFYNAEHDGYTCAGGVGIGDSPVITIQGFTQEEDLVHINLNFSDVYRENQDMVLTIKLTDQAYHFVSYLPQQNVS